MSAIPILAVLVVLLLIAVGAYFSHLQQKRRREEMALLARELNWKFYPNQDADHDDEYAHFAVFRQGHSRYAYNTLWGALEIDGRRHAAKMGDFHYKITSGSGKSRNTQTYRLSYLVLHLPYLRVPDLLIRQEGLFDKLAGVFGFDDIDFESAEFSRRFCVKSSDKRFAYDVIDPRMMEFLLSTSPPAVDIEHQECCLCDGKKCWSPAEFRARLKWSSDFFAHWPKHVTTALERS